MKKLCLIRKTMSPQKSKQKKRRLGREKREKRYDWIAIYFEKSCIRDVDTTSIETVIDIYSTTSTYTCQLSPS